MRIRTGQCALCTVQYGIRTGQWGSNDDLGKSWQSTARCSGPAVTTWSAKNFFLIFKSHNIAIIASSCGGMVINISWLQSDITKCIRRLYFCTAWLFYSKNIVMNWLMFQGTCDKIVNEQISFFADAPGLDHRMSAIAGMNPPPSLQVICFIDANTKIITKTNTNTQTYANT